MIILWLWAEIFVKINTILENLIKRQYFPKKEKNVNNKSIAHFKCGIKYMLSKEWDQIYHLGKGIGWIIWYSMTKTQFWVSKHTLRKIC